MWKRPTKEINAEFPAEEKFLDGIRRIVRESCAVAGMDRKDTSAVLLAIEEGATNIIRHAYLYERGTLRLRIVVYKKLIAISLMDTGRSFDPQGSGRINLERLVESGRRGGLGFYMIQKIMDSVEYISAAGLNELRMIKRLHRSMTTTPPLIRRMFTLRVKFSVWTMLIVCLIVGGAFYYVDSKTKREVYAHLDETVYALTRTIADQAAAYIINHRSDVEFDELVISYLHSNAMLRQIVLTDSSNLILAHSDDIKNIRKTYAYPGHLRSGPQPYPQRYQFMNEDLNFWTLPIRVGDRALGLAHVTYSSSHLQALLSSARRVALLVTAGLLCLGILGVYFLSNYFVRPIARITDRVRRFSSGDLETELPLEGADEFFEISRALNDMMTRLSRDRRNVIEREKMAKEIEVAAQIQKTLLPGELPKIPGLELDAFYRAASMVGGDLYDVFETGPGRYCLVVADVSGKGVPASLVMSMLRTVIQIYAADARSARETLIKVNEYLVPNMPAGMFITVLMAIYESSDRRLSVASAGHNALLYYKAESGEMQRLNPPGMPLGVEVTLRTKFATGLEEAIVDMEPGDCFVMYTDGITESIDRERKQFGVERLSQFLLNALASRKSGNLHDLSQALVGEIDSFSGFARQNDDITFIVARTVTR